MVPIKAPTTSVQKNSNTLEFLSHLEVDCCFNNKLIESANFSGEMFFYLTEFLDLWSRFIYPAYVSTCFVLICQIFDKKQGFLLAELLLGEIALSHIYWTTCFSVNCEDALKNFGKTSKIKWFQRISFEKVYIWERTFYHQPLHFL